MVCVLVLKDGPEKCAVFHEEDVKKRVVELGYIKEEELKKRFTLSGIGLFVPMLILAIPILDTLFAILRRIIHHKPIYEADKQHIHHQPTHI